MRPDLLLILSFASSISLAQQNEALPALPEVPMTGVVEMGANGAPPPPPTYRPAPQGAPELPFNPRDLAATLREMDQVGAVLDPKPPSKMQSGILHLSMEPGSEAPIIEVPYGLALTLEIRDAGGKPWPIRYVNVGRPDESIQLWYANKANTTTDNAATPVAFTDPSTAPVVPDNAPAQKTGFDHILMITPRVFSLVTNASLLLQGAETPVSIGIHVVERADIVTDRITLVVDDFGPGTSTTARTYQAPARDDLYAVLHGNAPPNAQWIDTKDDDLLAWSDGRTLWMRSRDRLLNPAPMAVLSGGTWSAYRTTAISPVLISRQGRLVEISLRLPSTFASTQP